MKHRRRSDVYRDEIARLIEEQNLPICPHDGKPCSNLEFGCFVQGFGVMDDDIIWSCPRLPQYLLEGHGFHGD